METPKNEATEVYLIVLPSHEDMLGVNMETPKKKAKTVFEMLLPGHQASMSAYMEKS